MPRCIGSARLLNHLIDCPLIRIPLITVAPVFLCNLPLLFGRILPIGKTGKLRIFEIYPPKPLHSMALGSRIPALREDYKTGRLCGRYFLATVGKLLAKNAPLPRQTPKIVVPGPVVVPPAPVANDAHAPVVANAPQANDTTFNNEDLA